MDKKSGSWFTRFKHKNENLALILVGLFIILAIVFVVTIANNHPWVTFRFNPEEYGTLSDWIMVIVTLVTAVFLYQTLRSQMTVQRDQEKINRLTSYDIRSKYRAEITLDNPQKYPLSDFDFKYLQFHVKDNNALQIEIKSEGKFIVDSHFADYSINNNLHISHISMLNKDDWFRIAITDDKVSNLLNRLKDSEKTDTYVPLISFSINYFDNFEFQYAKSFYFAYRNDISALELRTSNTQYI